jgi:PIN domain nuclease of toxin-antitoxin system
MAEPEPRAVLDGTALLAYLDGEPGAHIVSEAIAGGAAVSAVNVAEVLTALARRGHDPAEAASELTARGLLDGALTVEQFTSADAVEVARLRALTFDAGLSVADRACLALARRLQAPVYTANPAWLDVEIGVDVRAVRPSGVAERA